MPQGRRKAPFSGKAKKQQMQAKKQRKTQVLLTGPSSKEEEEDNNDFSSRIKKINKQPKDKSGKSSIYALQFFQESKEELQRRREEARQTIEPCPKEKQEISDDYFPSEIDMPKRPPWDFQMSKEQLEMREQRYFHEYLKKIENLANISYFELNLETWRQLWRVVEMCDLLLIIVDIRYPVMMFPPYLYNYVTSELGKDIILVLNKVDLAPAALVVAWQEYFKTKYPKLHILIFTSFPSYNLRNNVEEEKFLKSRKRKGKLKMAAEGAQKIMEACKKIVGEKINFTSWEKKIQEEMHLEYDFEDLKREDNVVTEKNDTSYFEHEKYKNGILTIGCVGSPNVGKSSLINALMGKKVVSVSRTPGHTKHFQTIFLTKEVCLCDCPGLVFPSTVPKQFQILMGSYPIAQVREPYTTVKFLAERIDLPSLLKLQHQDNDDTWSAMDICDSWAIKKNFHTAKAARPDTYRAANSLLRMALEGKICIYAYPPGWFCDKDKWENHPEVEIVNWIQARIHSNDDKPLSVINSSSESETEEENVEEHESLEEKSSAESSEESPEEEEPKIASGSNKFSVLTEN